jgi:hypothetical protein
MLSSNNDLIATSMDSFQGTQDGTARTCFGAENAQLSWEVVGGVFIVRFKGYRMAEEHRRLLEQGAVSSAPEWRWLERRNEATRFPTDFGLLSIADGAVESIKVLSVLNPTSHSTSACQKSVTPARGILDSLAVLSAEASSPNLP